MNISQSTLLWASLEAQMVKNLPAMQETWVWSLGQEDALEKEMATHSSILAWRSPWTEESGKYSPWGCKEMDGTEWHTHTHTFFYGHSFFLPLTLSLLPSFPTFPVSLFSHSLSHRSYLLHFGCSCLQAASVRTSGVVMEKHVWLDEHLSGSSVFVFLCVGISVREWIFVWICKLGCDFAFLGGVSWVMRMYNCWYIHLKYLVWRRCFYSPCVESPSDWGFGEVNSVKERLGVRSSFFLISLPHLSFLFLPLSFPSSNRGMCLVEWKAGLWYRGGEAWVMDWEADREAL